MGDITFKKWKIRSLKAYQKSPWAVVESRRRQPFCTGLGGYQPAGFLDEMTAGLFSRKIQNHIADFLAGGHIVKRFPDLIQGVSSVDQGFEFPLKE